MNNAATSQIDKKYWYLPPSDELEEITKTLEDRKKISELTGISLSRLGKILHNLAKATLGEIKTISEVIDQPMEELHKNCRWSQLSVN